MFSKNATFVAASIRLLLVLISSAEVKQTLYADTFSRIQCGDMVVDDSCGDCVQDFRAGDQYNPPYKIRQNCCEPLGWFNADYLIWWSKPMNVPTLATTSPDGTAVGSAGVLGESTTSELFGNSGINGDSRSGGRFELGMWLDRCRGDALEVTYLFLGEEGDSFLGSSDEFAILARPFFNIAAGTEDARLIAFDGVVDGSLNVSSETSLHTSAITFRRALVRDVNYKIDYLLGYRFALLDDTISIRESTTSLSGATAGTTIDLFDSFDTRNTFHGGEFGLEVKQRLGRFWSCRCTARVALGGSQSRTRVMGQTKVFDGTTMTTTAGGLLTQASNSGTFKDTNFNTVSEVGFTLHREITKNVAFTFGYNFLFWSDVMRASEQIDRSVNPTQIPPNTLVGEARPELPLDSTTYWAQGMRLGLACQF